MSEVTRQQPRRRAAVYESRCFLVGFPVRRDGDHVSRVHELFVETRVHERFAEPRIMIAVQTAFSFSAGCRSSSEAAHREKAWIVE